MTKQAEQRQQDRPPTEFLVALMDWVINNAPASADSQKQLKQSA